MKQLWEYAAIGAAAALMMLFVALWSAGCAALLVGCVGQVQGPMSNGQSLPPLPARASFPARTVLGGQSDTLAVPAVGRIFACDVEQSDIVGLLGCFVTSATANGTNWMQVETFQYDGRTHFYTSNVPCYVRAKMLFPK